MSASLDRARLSDLTRAIVDRIEGDWLLIGGALAALWFAPRRTTEAIDLVPMGEPKQDRMALFELAAELGLPIEALNSAADFLIERVPRWRGPRTRSLSHDATDCEAPSSISGVQKIDETCEHELEPSRLAADDVLLLRRARCDHVLQTTDQKTLCIAHRVAFRLGVKPRCGESVHSRLFDAELGSQNGAPGAEPERRQPT